MKKTRKPPKMKGYAGGGPVEEFSWDDYYKRLDAWEKADAQNVPQDIVQYQSQWIVPQIKQAQVALNAALAAKYGLKPGQAPNAKQALDQKEVEAVLGKEGAAAYYANVEGYQSYRNKTAGSYKAPKVVAGAFDPGGKMYGPRHFNLFTLSPEQAAANVAETRKEGKPISQEEANKIAAEPPKTTTSETAVPQDMTPSGGIAPPPGKPYDWTPALESPAQQQAGAQTQPAAQAPRYEKYVTNYGQTFYYTYDQAGNRQQIQQQQYDSGVASNPNAQLYLLDESTGLYDEQGQPKTMQLQQPAQQQAAPAPEQQPQPQPQPQPAPPKLKKGGKVGKKKGYQEGGFIMPEGLSPEQQTYLDSLGTDAEKQAYVDSLGLSGNKPGLTSTQKAIASAAPAVGNLAAAGVEMIDVDPLNKKGQIAQGVGAGALRGAGQGAALGTAIAPGIGTVVGAGVGALAGGITGGIKKKKQYNVARQNADEAARQAAIAGSYTDSGYAEGGKIKGPGTAKSDDIPARVKKGSFIVPAENAKMAEMLRAKYLKKEGGKAKLKQGGNTSDVYLSNGEHLFTPDEVKILKANKIDVEGLAPNSEETGYGYADGGVVKPSKAREILRDGTVHGKALTAKQKRYFGWIAGKGMQGGGPVTGDISPEEEKAILKSHIEQYQAETDPQKKEEIYNSLLNLLPDGSYWETHRAELKQTLEGKPSKLNIPEPDVKVDVGINKSNVRVPAKTSQEQKSKPKTEVGTGEVASKTDPAQIKALQEAFIKEHGGIGYQDVPRPTEAGTQAVASNPIDPLKKKWQELMDAGKVVEAQEVEKEMKAMGYRYQYDNATKKGDWVSAAGKSIGVEQPTGVAGALQGAAGTEMADMEAEDDAAQSAKGVPPSAMKRVYESLGPGAILGIAQAGLGLAQTLGQKNKAPKMEVDPDLQRRQREAIAAASTGLSPAEYANAANRIEMQRANVFNKISSISGGDVGVGIGNTRLAAIDANRSRLDLAAADERMRMAKEGRADQLTAQVAAQRQAIYNANMQMFQQNQAASAELINAGLANLVGSISARENQKRIDQRMEKYGTVNFTLPGTT